MGASEIEVGGGTLVPAEKTAPRRRLHVLIVDDNLDQVHTMAYLLKDMGHHADYAINGIVALDLAQRFRPDVILLDIQLPDTSGFNLVRQFRHNPELKGTYIVGISAFALTRTEVLGAGFDELLGKPVDLRRLEALLEGL